ARRSGALTRSVAPMPATEARPASLRIDLTGMGTPDDITTLALRFGGGPSVRSVIDSIVAGHIPDIDLMIDGRPVARARPMIDNRASIAAGVDDVLARTATLVVAIA